MRIPNLPQWVMNKKPEELKKVKKGKRNGL
jgi:hypothetical protein